MVTNFITEAGFMATALRWSTRALAPLAAGWASITKTDTESAGTLARANAAWTVGGRPCENAVIEWQSMPLARMERRSIKMEKLMRT